MRITAAINSARIRIKKQLLCAEAFIELRTAADCAEKPGKSEPRYYPICQAQHFSLWIVRRCCRRGYQSQLPINARPVLAKHVPTEPPAQVRPVADEGAADSPVAFR